MSRGSDSGIPVGERRVTGRTSGGRGSRRSGTDGGVCACWRGGADVSSLGAARKRRKDNWVLVDGADSRITDT